MLRMSLTRSEVTALATYHALGDAGYVHTPAYRWQMAVLLWRYRVIHREIALDLGLTPFVAPRTWQGVPDGDLTRELNRYIEPRAVL